jgi:molybdenum cofactor cytidylyltransferase
MITAILLAAGQSKRVPTKNKLLIKYRKKLLINHILDQLIKSKIEKIIIVLGHEYFKVRKLALKSKKIKVCYQ